MAFSHWPSAAVIVILLSILRINAQSPASAADQIELTPPDFSDLATEDLSSTNSAASTQSEISANANLTSTIGSVNTSNLVGSTATNELFSMSEGFNGTASGLMGNTTTVSLSSDTTEADLASTTITSNSVSTTSLENGLMNSTTAASENSTITETLSSTSELGSLNSLDSALQSTEALNSTITVESTTLTESTTTSALDLLENSTDSELLNASSTTGSEMINTTMSNVTTTATEFSTASTTAAEFNGLNSTMEFLNASTTIGLESTNASTTIGLESTNASTAIGLESTNASTAIGLESASASTTSSSELSNTTITMALESGNGSTTEQSLNTTTVGNEELFNTTASILPELMNGSSTSAELLNATVILPESLNASTARSVENTTTSVQESSSALTTEFTVNASEAMLLPQTETFETETMETFTSSITTEAAFANGTTENFNSTAVTTTEATGNNLGSTMGQLMKGTMTGNKFNCSNLIAGYYGNPEKACDTKFYICVDPLVPGYPQHCPGRLYYDSEMKQCDMWAHIPACSGKARPTVSANETAHIAPTFAPVVGCRNLTDGIYADPSSTPQHCSNRYFSCVGGREFRLFCPANLYFDSEHNECRSRGNVFACTGSRTSNEAHRYTQPPAMTLPPVNFDCSGRNDGYYVEKCDSVYYGCTGGLAREFRCPDGLVFDSDQFSCEAPSDTLICSGTRRPSTTRSPSTTRRAVSTTPSPLDCNGKPDGIYRDPEEKCSRIFYYCAHNETIQNICPGRLFYDDGFKRCDLWINVFDCSGTHRTSTVKPSTVAPTSLPAVDFDCSELEDGNYVNPNSSCSQFFYICANMEAFKVFCPSDLFYNQDANNCDSWSNIFECSHVTKRPTTIRASPASLGTTPKPEFDCNSRPDGTYLQDATACSTVYFRCVAGVPFKFSCPGGLYYDVVGDLCDWRDNVFACSGRTHPPSTPSTSPHSTPSTASTAKPPIDCRVLRDGDYEDPNHRCSNVFYTCSAGYAIKRECPGETYYDSGLKICDLMENVPACTGRSRPTTMSSPVTDRTTHAPYPFDCTRLNDGNYPADKCSSEFWSCVGGLTFHRKCPLEFVYDDENDACEFRALVPKCGGHRITTGRPVSTPSTTPVGGFSCTFRIDGNYVDPEAEKGCSSIYYTCYNGMTARVHCPAGLFYDSVNDTCNAHDEVQACIGVEISSKSNFTAVASVSPSINETDSTLEQVQTTPFALQSSITELLNATSSTTEASLLNTTVETSTALSTGTNFTNENTTTALTTSSNFTSEFSAATETESTSEFNSTTESMGNTTAAMFSPELELSNTTVANSTLETTSMGTELMNSTTVAFDNSTLPLNVSTNATENLVPIEGSLFTGSTDESVALNTTAASNVSTAESTASMENATASISNLTENSTGSELLTSTTMLSTIVSEMANTTMSNITTTASEFVNVSTPTTVAEFNVSSSTTEFLNTSTAIESTNATTTISSGTTPLESGTAATTEQSLNTTTVGNDELLNTTTSISSESNDFANSSESLESSAATTPLESGTAATTERSLNTTTVGNDELLNTTTSISSESPNAFATSSELLNSTAISSGSTNTLSIQSVETSTIAVSESMVNATATENSLSFGNSTASVQ